MQAPIYHQSWPKRPSIPFSYATHRILPLERAQKGLLTPSGKNMPDFGAASGGPRRRDTHVGNFWSLKAQI